MGRFEDHPGAPPFGRQQRQDPATNSSEWEVNQKLCEEGECKESRAHVKVPLGELEQFTLQTINIEGNTIFFGVTNGTGPGLQPKSDGLQPTSDGLQPKSDERWPPT